MAGKDIRRTKQRRNRRAETRVAQRDLINRLLDGVRDELIARLERGALPADWNEHDLRAVIACLI